MGEEKKITTIRGIDRELYTKITALAKEMGKTVGDMINEAMKLYLLFTETSAEITKSLSRTRKAFVEGFRERTSLIIRDLDQIQLSKSDLERYKRKISLIKIKRVIFDKDVDEDTFEKYIDLIAYCEEVLVPKSIPRLLVYSRCRQVSKITFIE